MPHSYGPEKYEHSNMAQEGAKKPPCGTDSFFFFGNGFQPLMHVHGILVHSSVHQPTDTTVACAM
jgi:hypothetical protein